MNKLNAKYIDAIKSPQKRERIVICLIQNSKEFQKSYPNNKLSMQFDIAHY